MMPLRSTEQLMPVIVPAEFSRDDWPGPIQALGARGLCLTWGLLGEHQTIAYVSHADAARWEANGVAWRAKALENLRRRSEEQPYSHRRDDEEGRAIFVALLHEDGLGPSRLLVPHLFDEVFPERYRVTVPERSCAILYRHTLTGRQAEVVEMLIESCFRGGAQPVSLAHFAPESFWS